MTGVKARRRTKAGDGYPLDVTANFLSQGAIVALTDPEANNPALELPGLVLGYVKRLGKSYADVVVLRRPAEPGGDPVRVTVRLRDPSRQLIVVDGDSLNSQVKEFEALKMAAATDRDYS